MKFRIELIWKDDADTDASSIYLTPDGSIILQGTSVDDDERSKLHLPTGVGLIRVDRNLVRAIKDML